MQKWKTSFCCGPRTLARSTTLTVVFSLLAVTGLAQTAHDFEAPQVNRVAEKMNCSCGCKMNMACLMPPYPCPVCRQAKSKIIALQAEGKSDRQILDQFAQENGKDILVVQPGVMGVVGPYLALALGLGFVIFIIRRFRRPQTAAPAGPPLDAATLDRIEKDLAKLD